MTHPPPFENLNREINPTKLKYAEAVFELQRVLKALQYRSKTLSLAVTPLLIGKTSVKCHLLAARL